MKEFFGIEKLEKKDIDFVAGKLEELQGKEEKKKARTADEVSSTENITKPSSKKARK